PSPSRRRRVPYLPRARGAGSDYSAAAARRGIGRAGGRDSRRGNKGRGGAPQGTFKSPGSARTTFPSVLRAPRLVPWRRRTGRVGRGGRRRGRRLALTSQRSHRLRSRRRPRPRAAPSRPVPSRPVPSRPVPSRLGDRPPPASSPPAEGGAAAAGRLRCPALPCPLRARSAPLPRRRPGFVRLRPAARPAPPRRRGSAAWRQPCPRRRAWPCRRPWTGPVVYVLDLADRLISKACPFAAAGIMVGSIYWTAVTYGAVTVMQVVGHKEGLDVMERADPLFLLIGLPTIPVMLILGKMIRWEDYVLRLWRKYSNKLQILNSIFPGIGCPVPRIPAEANPLADHVSATRILCGALVFPTIATIVGKLMFSSVNSNLQRTILGGIAFVAIKGAFKVYFKQQQYLRQAHRKILNYPEQEGA
uniref:Membrane associated ring-CH-type finger 5 n=1 Tax=Apteryx owenii TaxID=8824 RepID=A0A8B9NW30_APTOW